MNKYIISIALVCASDMAAASPVLSDQLFINNDKTALITLYEGHETATVNFDSFKANLNKDTDLVNLVLTETVKGKNGKPQTVISDVASLFWKVDHTSEGQNHDDEHKTYGHLSLTFTSGSDLAKPSNAQYGTIYETESKTGNIFDLTGKHDLQNCGINLGIDKVTIKSDVSAVPVPASAWLFGSALTGLGVFTRRKSTSCAA